MPEFTNNRHSNTSSPILVMAFGGKGVGDHVSCSSFVRNLARNCPNSAIDFAVFSQIGAELFKYNPYIRNIHVLDMDYLKLGRKYSLIEKYRYLKTFRRIHYEKVYILGTKFRHAVFAYLTGTRERIGYANHHRNFLLTRTLVEPPEKNIVERFLGLLLHDGQQVSDSSIELHLSDMESEHMNAVFRSRGIADTDQVIAVSPFAADMRRTWGIHRFWEVASYFAEKGNEVIILGSRQERRFLQDNPLPNRSHIINLVGELSILETAAAIKRSALFLGNDSGLGHIAGAVRTKGLILGYYITRVWSPLSPSIKTIIHDAGCTTCNLDECVQTSNNIPKCFASITTCEVIHELNEMLSKTTYAKCVPQANREKGDTQI